MRRSRLSLATVATVVVLAVLAIWVGIGGFSSNKGGQSIAGVPKQGQDKGQGPAVPAPEGTVLPTLPPPTPTELVIPTPTIHIWPTPVPVTGITTSTMSISADVGLAQKSTVDRTESISQMTWAPTGDKLLYLTANGDLYWSNPDGSSPALLHQYNETTYDQLEEQYPMANTILIRHLGQLQPDGNRAPSHLDVVRFTPGQPPIIQQGPDLLNAPIALRWWSTTRASGFAHTGFDGGDLLVTVDQNGNLVDEKNVPYMLGGAVQPGGEWLAYYTTYQVDNPVDGTIPSTGYLLNLNTGQRLQVTQPGGGIGNWSPDGNWFLAGSKQGVSLVSADGRQWFTIPDTSAATDGVWSPDSKYYAYAYVDGISTNGYTISSWIGAIHVVNVPQRKVTNISPGSNASASMAKTADGDMLLMQPKWSKDSKTITFLSFGSPESSRLTPAFVNMALSNP
ncbi:MAG: hypothetical protein IVW55_17350 [Chloroflexi bacterium]|nr:hypothetical protein [Chloroflexota bacterium]